MPNYFFRIPNAAERISVIGSGDASQADLADPARFKFIDLLVQEIEKMQSEALGRPGCYLIGAPVWGL